MTDSQFSPWVPAETKKQSKSQWIITLSSSSTALLFSFHFEVGERKMSSAPFMLTPPDGCHSVAIFPTWPDISPDLARTCVSCPRFFNSYFHIERSRRRINYEFPFWEIIEDNQLPINGYKVRLRVLGVGGKPVKREKSDRISNDNGEPLIVSKCCTNHSEI